MRARRGAACLALLVLAHLAPPAVDQYTDDTDENLTWLRNNVDPWETVEKKWTETSDYRLKHIYDGDDNITGYYNKYPALKQPKGYTLLLEDFNQMYPGKENNLFSMLNLKQEDILAYAEGKADYSRNKVIKNDIINLIGMIRGVCDVAGGAGSVNALPAGTSGAAAGRTAPSFDASTPRNVTALVGKSAYLSCRVRNLGNRTVSWIRHRDLHILTVGGYTYTSDQRFQATHAPHTDDWTLHIKWAQQRDAGVYECQVSTQPVRSFFVTLHVVVPSARILGGPDLHVDIGSTINLTCLIQFSPEPPAYIFWYHEDQVISYDSSRGGVSVVTEKGPATTSYLLVQDAQPHDSGRYSCAPSNAEVASVRVHVLNGERPAAMQTGSAGLSNSSRAIALLLAAAAAHARLLSALLNS